MLSEGFKEIAGNLPAIDSEAFIEAMQTPPSVGLRVNPLKRVEDFPWCGYADVSPVEWCEEGVRLPQRPVFTLNPLLHAGAFYVQDPSSMVYAPLMSQALSLLPKDRADSPKVLDLCASPGGKTTAMMSRLPDSAVVVANEYVAQRVGPLRENLSKWGWSRLIVCNSASDDFASAGPLFDIVAVDAPCSGEGMMRKDEDARSQWSAELVSRCAALQRDILRNAVEALRPGGVLIYSTCTFNLEEDERNASWIASELGLHPVATELEGIGGILGNLEGSIPALRFMPHATDGEGLFVAMFVKDGENLPDVSEPSCKSLRRREKVKKGKKNNPSADYPEIDKWLDDESGWRLVPDKGKTSLEALPEAAAEVAAALEPHVRIVGRGVEAAVLKGKEWTPASQLVLSTAYRPEAFPYCDLTEEDALRYLRREAIAVEGAPKGYVAVGYGGLPLGLVKNLGNRANNLYPAKWKIRFL